MATHYFQKQRLNRFIMDHLLRAGYFETAQKLSDYVGMDFQSTKYVFHVAKQVEESLARRDLSICLNWINDNRSRLNRLESTFETEIKIQLCAELIMKGHRREAVIRARNFFSQLSPMQWKDKNLLCLFGLLGLGCKLSQKSYNLLLSDERYKFLIDMFKQENQRIFQISSQSSYSACLHAGISAHKTPFCRKQLDSLCIICNSLYDLAEGLPVAHASNSNGELITEENRPIMLPNGHVYCENTIKMLTDYDKEIIICPKTKEIFRTDQQKKIFVL